MRVRRSREKKDQNKQGHHDCQGGEDNGGMTILVVVHLHHDEHHGQADRREDQLFERKVVRVAELGVEEVITLLREVDDINHRRRARIVDVTLSGPDPKLLIARPKAFAAEPSGGKAAVVPVEVLVPDECKKVRRVQSHAEAGTGPKLEDAKVVISGGTSVSSRMSPWIMR